MNRDYMEIVSRNIGIFSEEEQEKIRVCAMAVAGVGGVGGWLAERLIRIGVGQLRLTDPGVFETSNLNRQFACNMHSVGEYKVDEIYYELEEINPDAEIICDRAGIRSQEDADRFINGCFVVIDAMDYGLFRESVYLQRAARKRGAFYLFASGIGFGAMVVTFAPGGLTLEEFMGIPKDVNLDSTPQPVLTQKRLLPYVPSYIQDKMDRVARMVTGEIPGSTNSIGVGLASILAANEAVNVVLWKVPPVEAPRYTYVDLLDRVFIDQGRPFRNAETQTAPG
jgi:molybdopterin/thiamine biosynthesis adenylyltransferase